MTCRESFALAWPRSAVAVRSSTRESRRSSAPDTSGRRTGRCRRLRCDRRVRSRWSSTASSPSGSRDTDRRAARSPRCARGRRRRLERPPSDPPARWHARGPARVALVSDVHVRVDHRRHHGFAREIDASGGVGRSDRAFPSEGRDPRTIGRRTIAHASSIRLEHLAKPDERTDDEDADLNRAGAVQNARGHDRAVLREHKGQMPPAAMSGRTRGRNLRPQVGVLFLRQLKHEIPGKPPDVAFHLFVGRCAAVD